eukprot:5702619-Prymnesium_polylepis.1
MREVGGTALRVFRLAEDFPAIFRDLGFNTNSTKSRHRISMFDESRQKVSEYGEFQWNSLNLNASLRDKGRAYGLVRHTA